MIAEVIVDIAHSDVDKIFEYICDNNVQAGSRVKVPFGNRYLAGFVIKIKEKSDYDFSKLKRIAQVYEELPALNEERLSLAYTIAKRYRAPMASVLRLFLPAEMRKETTRELYREYAQVIEENPQINKNAKMQQSAYDYLKEKGKTDCAFLRKEFGAAINSLQKKGIISIAKERCIRSPYQALPEKNAIHQLTDAQLLAMQSIESSTQTVQLLHGVTGSGKTEVYLHLIADQLQKGKSAIFLVPEISLTPQMLSQLRARFGSNAAILHSGLSAGEKFDEWWRLRTGEAKIAIGARSAVFAPVENLGVIIIDEEHDSSYSSDSTPRYNTFEIALMRARTNECKLVLGSATPSVETYRYAKEGKYNLICLPDRINRKPLPEVTMVDMRREVRRGNNSSFSTALKNEITDTLSKKMQVIIFLNRRGYSQSVICTECGYVAKCESCDVTLTYHSEENCLKCHYCGAKYHMLTACPQCGGTHLRYAGTGTQRIATELQKLYPQARILRMDNDTVGGKDGHYKILKAFASHEADILVGTQMIAKGHDFPSVTLVGILDADMSLHFDDYRSGERTFQLITQVAGRSGRAEEKGKVVLQTYDPENAILRYAVRYDYEGFYENEISMRKAANFPPFAYIIRVMITGEDENKTLEVLKKVYFSLEEIYKKNAESFIFFNKMRSPIKRIEKKFRYQVLMRLTSKILLPQIYAVAAENIMSTVLVYVEENPSNLS